VRILTKLDHPNIVKYYETYEDIKYMYLVMEYCPGGELFKRITQKNESIFNESEAASIMKKLLRAINYCHSQGIVHRDIKAENIMYGKDGEVKLIDFGLSKAVANKNSTLTTIAGTPFYMAPEVMDNDYNSQCDIWSLGVLMYVLLSGYMPFQAESR
jgi:calcium-dependent protein kinase